MVVTSGGEVPPAHALKPSINMLSQLSDVDSQHVVRSDHSAIGENNGTNGVDYKDLRKSMVAASRFDGWSELQK